MKRMRDESEIKKESDHDLNLISNGIEVGDSCASGTSSELEPIQGMDDGASLVAALGAIGL